MTIPSSVNQSVTTDSSGSWSVTDANLINATNYKILLSFLDALKDSIVYSEDIKTSSTANKINFPDMYYPDFVSSTVTGEIMNGDAP